MPHIPDQYFALAINVTLVFGAAIALYALVAWLDWRDQKRALAADELRSRRLRQRIEHPRKDERKGFRP